MKKNLLTIGDVSKKTGCSIKSLRYYDSIGLLKPIYVDPNTNYRYYNFEQTKIVEIIQLCILLDIPLKDVKELTIKNDNTMDYSNLIEYGRKITKEKIIKLQNNLDFLDTLKDEIERLNSYDNDEEKSFHIDEKYYYVMPIFEDETNEFNLIKIYEMFSDIVCSEKTIIVTSSYSYDFSSPYFEVKCSL